MWQYHSLTSQRQCLENLGKSLYDWPTNSKTLRWYLSLITIYLYAKKSYTLITWLQRY